MKFEKIDQWFANAQDIPELRATLPEPLFATQHEADEFDRLFDDFLNAGPGRDGLTDQDIDHMRVKFRALVPMRVLLHDVEPDGTITWYLHFDRGRHRGWHQRPERGQ